MEGRKDKGEKGPEYGIFLFHIKGAQLLHISMVEIHIDKASDLGMREFTDTM